MTSTFSAPTTDTANAVPQNLRAFRIYVAYRSILSLLLLIMLVSPNTRELVGNLNPQLYLGVALAYLASNVLLIGSLIGNSYRNTSLLLIVFLVDILAITLLADTSGGMRSGLPILLAVSVAASAILLNNQTLATLVAAVSVIAILADTVRLISMSAVPLSNLLPAGLLGLLIFGVSLLVQAVAARLGRAEALARDRASDLYNLQRLNEQIVQNLQTGIALVSNGNSVRILNKSAARLLSASGDESGTAAPLDHYSTGLQEQLEQFRASGSQPSVPLQIDIDAPPIIASFQTLQPATGKDLLMFIEDYSPVTQYAQSLKLTSLGRLTASIAHEIRNPLGAISHAAQLLQESSELAVPDQRLADIIQSHSERMNTIIESVMQISRREPPKPQLLLLVDWLRSFVEDFAATLSGGQQITIICDYPELQVEFDPENLQRVIRNLLENALRHSKLATGAETAEIRVELDFDSQRCLIDVLDDGEGVPDSERAKLFEPFYTTVREGSGMGLFLCTELCEINNAQLSYLKTGEGRSCFRVSLPHRATQ